MTLPFPDSPAVDENIGTSIARIKDNLDYLDAYIGSGNTRCLVSMKVDLSTKTGNQIITGVGFAPKAMVVFATYQSMYMNSWGAATVGSVSTSVDCACVAQNHTYAGTASSLEFALLYQSTGTYIAGSVGYFTNDGVSIEWSNYNSAAGTVGNIMYIFFG